ncbi:MAG: DUF2865 domain-containing protein [Hyphomicrobiaceae bacterium]
MILSKRVRISLILAALGLATIHASADVLNGSAVISNESANPLHEGNSDDLSGLASPDKDYWSGGVFSGQRRVSNVPKVATPVQRNLFYGLRANGYAEAAKQKPQSALEPGEATVAKAKSNQPRRLSVSRKRRYRTVCVRLCDGYYFPISESSPFQNLRRDEARCQARCNLPAELYVAPVNQDPQSRTTQLMSLSGTPYMDLKTAYLYRTKMVPSCSCMAPPNSNEAKKRHADYIDKKIDKITKRVAEVESDVGQSLRTAGRFDRQVHLRRPARYAVQSPSTVIPRSRPGPRFQPRRQGRF